MEVILSRDRLKGFQQAMLQHELDMEPVLVQEGDFTYQSGFNLMSKLCGLDNPPSAVFAANDEMAIGAIKAAKKHGINVPEQLAVVGFDNIKISSIFEPELTTTDQPKFEIGQKAMDTLLKLMNSKNLSKRQIILKDELIVRESCGFHLKV